MFKPDSSWEYYVSFTTAHIKVNIIKLSACQFQYGGRLAKEQVKSNYFADYPPIPANISNLN